MLHGGDIYTDGILKGKNLLDYSSNINPLGTPKGFAENIGEALRNVVRYPDIKYRELIDNIKNYIGVKNVEYILGNGAAEIIDLSISCFQSILIVVPSFVEYEINAKKWNCKIEYSYLSRNMEFDYNDIMNKLKNVEAVIIGNPNNPNGGTIDKDKFQEILDFCEENEKTIIIDEAFIEFAGEKEHGFAKYTNKYKCLFIIRAVTKFFAMPGVRFGYGITKNIKLATSIKEKQNPWNINCFAELAVKYSFSDEKYIKKSLLWIEEERSFLFHELCEVNCFERVFPTDVNFILCKLKDIDEDELYDFCVKKEIIIRKASNFRGLNKGFIRLAIKDRESNERLIKELKSYS
jgi:threonine-phosphate decarboxylase